VRVAVVPYRVVVRTPVCHNNTYSKVAVFRRNNTTKWHVFDGLETHTQIPLTLRKMMQSTLCYAEFIESVLTCLLYYRYIIWCVCLLESLEFHDEFQNRMIYRTPCQLCGFRCAFEHMLFMALPALLITI